MAKMTYKMTLATGISLEKLTIHTTKIPLANDQVSATLYENTKGRQLYITTNEVNVFVQASGAMIGLEWSLEITIGGKKLTEEPIKGSVNAAGNAGLNKSYPW